MGVEGFFDRVRADLAAERRRRLGELAVQRGFLEAARLASLLGETPVAEPLEESLLSRGGLRPSQVDELLREIDGPVAPSRDPHASRYEVGEKLGEGAVSIVHRGLDRELGRPVALKFLREGLLPLDKIRERFHREAQSLARMDHPNVVKVHDVGSSGEKLFLVMELVDGETFSVVLIREPRGSRRAIELLEQAARGVHHAHEKGIVHRDLKPDNILVAGGATAKVADFGLAHFLEAGPSLTRSGTVLGTPMYMAPEQVHGQSEVSRRTDVYALGAILYQILTGRTPHSGDRVTQIYEKILTEDPLPPRKILDSVPWELEAVALKAMEKDPARRYATAEAFAEELRRWRAGEGVEARPVSTLARTWRRLLRHRARVALVALAAAVAIAAGTMWSVGRSRLRGALADAEAKERDGRTQAARDAYLRALGLDAGDLRAQVGADRTRAAIQRASNLLEAARPILEKAVAGTYSAEVGADEVQQGAAQARELLAKALPLAGDLALSHYRMGEVWEISGDYDRAGEAFRRAVEIDPRSGPSQYRLGRILLWRGYLASLNMWTVPDPADAARAEQYARDGAAAIEIARSEGSGFDDELRRDAAAAMIDFLRRDPDATRARCAAGIAKYGKREGAEEFHWLRAVIEPSPAEAVRGFDAALAIRPKFAFALYSRAWVGGRPREDFSEALRCAPGFSEPLIFRGSHYLTQPNQVAEAVVDFDELIRRGVHLAPAFNGRGFAKLKLQDYAGAVQDFTEALRIRSENYHLPWMGRAEARLQMGDLDGALGDISRAFEIEKGPGRRKVLSLRGRIRWKKGDRFGAVEDFKAAGSDGRGFLQKIEAGQTPD